MAGGTFAAADLERFAADLLAAAGLRPEHAATIARILVWADLRGIGSHGFQRLAQAVENIEKGVIVPSGAPEVVRDAGAITLIDGNRCAGHVAMERAVAAATEKAKAHAVGWAIVRNTSHTGAIGYYCEALARQGFIGISIVSGPPLMAYHGASVASLSTSPIAIAVPRQGHAPVVLDMATSVVANGRIKKAAAEGEAIPPDWALTKDGRITTDPKEAAVILPLGGPKGAGLGLMFECLSSVLAGAPLLTRMLGPGGKRFHSQNGTLIAVDIAALMPVEDYASGVDELAATIKALPRLDGFDAIRLPGERGAASEAERREKGVPVSAKLAASLEAVGGRYGVAWPATVG
ncbi:MAG: hypothetical protein RLZ98_827 [Pseudomonadota bacterium]|jgi:ureidoglycolate dehydrogenase (NAD+)